MPSIFDGHTPEQTWFGENHPRPHPRPDLALILASPRLLRQRDAFRELAKALLNICDPCSSHEENVFQDARALFERIEAEIAEKEKAE